MSNESYRDRPKTHSARDRSRTIMPPNDDQARSIAPHIDPKSVRNEDDILAQLSRSHRAQKMAMEKMEHQASHGHYENVPALNKKNRKLPPSDAASGNNVIFNRIMLAALVAAILIMIDQASKFSIRDLLYSTGNKPIIITDFFSLVSAWNPGVSFGFFSSGGQVGDIIFLILPLAVSGYLIWRITQGQNLLQNLGSYLIMGGALGNMFDRINFGAVYDFLLFHIGDFAFPVFNFADTCITIGVIFMLLDWKFSDDVVEEKPTK